MKNFKEIGGGMETQFGNWISEERRAMKRGKRQIIESSRTQRNFILFLKKNE